MLKVDDLARSVPSQSLKAGDVLVEQGTRTGKVFILASGTLEVLRDGVKICDVSDRGAPLGEIAALLGGEHQAKVVAKSDASVLVVEDFDKLTQEHPEVPVYLAQTLARRLTATNAILAEAKREFEQLLDEQGETGDPGFRKRVKAAWDRFGNMMRTEIADF